MNQNMRAAVTLKTIILATCWMKKIKKVPSELY